MGRVDDCVAIAEQPEVIFTTFGDAMRVPGSRKSLLQAKADGADVRMVYSPMDALALARANPDREVVFFGLGFETTMPSTALTILAGRSGGESTNFSVFCNHITIVPTIKAILDSPDLRLDGFLGPGHVSMVIGTAPYEFIARYLSQADGHRRLRAARHPAVDLDGPEADQGGARRDRKSIRPRRSGSAATRRRCAPSRASMNCANSSSGGAWARSIIPASGCATPTPASTPSENSPFPNVRIADPKSCQCGEVLKGVIKPLAVQGVRLGLHAGDAARRADGVVRRRLRRLLSVWRASGSHEAAE